MSRRRGKRGQTGGMNPCPEKPKTAKITKTTTLMGTGNIHRRIYRGLLKCYMHSKVFNADLVGAYNVLLKNKNHTPEPHSTRGRGNAPETGCGAEPSVRWGCSSKPP
ncbi:MAG: hypothetical protein QXM78_02105 [Sulfolobales archaeon]